MRRERRTLLLLALAMLAVSQPAQARPPAAAKSGIPPFCVLTGGPRGAGSLPQICRFFDYQQCLLAAAQLRGNCVVNIDYPGKIVSAPGGNWTPAR
ncbi:MAG: hypothetical protein JWR89_644 [Tardiphaga sp.]|uniref:DUF3551 domain-containing protein n=1 Tax=Tardiphaga sp. TaxID=1926292 RepID=UPI00262B1E34|nr:DUF3551 domain-containing protein [Tardiphaga sp.]MDB5500742.1 hypothetical protein [Tardiphaga sp.]